MSKGENPPGSIVTQAYVWFRDLEAVARCSAVSAAKRLGKYYAFPSDRYVKRPAQGSCWDVSLICKRGDAGGSLPTAAAAPAVTRPQQGERRSPPGQPQSYI